MAAPNISTSTGPRTPEGKARSSQNATKHGFTSKNTIIDEGMQKAFDELLAAYEKDIRPVGAIEETLFKQLVQNAWTLRRIELKKTEMATDGKDPLSESADSSKARNYDRIERYQARYEGAFRSTLKELRALQTSRVIQMAIPDQRSCKGAAGAGCQADFTQRFPHRRRNHRSAAIRTVRL